MSKFNKPKKILNNMPFDCFVLSSISFYHNKKKMSYKEILNVLKNLVNELETKIIDEELE